MAVKRKTTITSKMIEQAGMLAGKGYSVSMIADALGIGYKTCWNNEGIREAIKRGQSQARQKVVDDLMARSEADQSATSSIFLAKQLKVFDNPFTTATPKTLEDIAQRTADIYQAVSAGTLDGEKGDRLISYLDKMVKVMEVADIENRLKALEAKQDGK